MYSNTMMVVCMDDVLGNVAEDLKAKAQDKVVYWVVYDAVVEIMDFAFIPRVHRGIVHPAWDDGLHPQLCMYLEECR